jgi:hypothetical protein
MLNKSSHRLKIKNPRGYVALQPVAFAFALYGTCSLKFSERGKIGPVPLLEDRGLAWALVVVGALIFLFNSYRLIRAAMKADQAARS